MNNLELHEHLCKKITNADLLAKLELHQPYLVTDGVYAAYWCNQCDGWSPCPTYKAIEKELG